MSDDLRPDHPCFDNDDDMVDDELEDFFDCLMMRDGSCGAAGSEDCEFECPYRRDQRERAYARRKADEPGSLL